MKPLFKKNTFGLFDSAENYFIPTTESHSSELLLRQCLNASPLNCIVGPHGSGRTASAFWIYHSLSYADYEIVYISALNRTKKDSFLRTSLSLMGYPNLSDESPKNLFKRLINEAEDIQSEGRSLLFIIDDPSEFNGRVWAQQIEPILAINNIQDRLFSFLLVLDDNTKSKLQQEYRCHFGASLHKSYLRREELAAYLKTRLKASSTADSLFSEKALDKIYTKSAGHFTRVNELALVELQKTGDIGPLAEERASVKLDPIRAEPLVTEQEVYEQENAYTRVEKKHSILDFDHSNTANIEEYVGNENKALQQREENDPMRFDGSDYSSASRPIEDLQVKELKEAGPDEGVNKKSDDSWGIIATLLKSS